MEIPNPRRILVVGAQDSGILDLLQDLTGSIPAPHPTTPSLAGLSHTLVVKTAYYTASLPIWIDSLPHPESETLRPPLSPPSSTAPAAPLPTWPTWASEYTSPSAREVLSALGAIIAVFRKPVSPSDFAEIGSFLAQVKRVADACGRADRDGLGDGDWDGVCVAVGMRRGVLPGLEVADEEWEDVCRGVGFEFVDGEVRGGKRDGFGELNGIARLSEALEANDWASNDDGFDLDDLDEVDEEEGTGFGVEAAELEMEMFGMKRAVFAAGEGDEVESGEGKEEHDQNEEDEVEKLEALMLRMQAVRDMGADLPETEKRRFAARAVRDIMKTL